MPLRVAHGFPGQTMLVVPRPVIRQALEQTLPVAAVPSDVGYFPAAKDHYVERQNGADEAILILCVEGKGWARINHAEFPVMPGQLLAILPRQGHSYGADSGDPWSIFWCHAAGAHAIRLAAMLLQSAPSPVLGVSEHLRLVSLFENMIEALSHGYGPDHLVAASGALMHLLSLSYSLTRGHLGSDTDVHLRIRQVVAYLRQRPFGHIRIPDLARKCNLSTSHFCSMFKATTGFPPLDFFLRLKVQHACVLLATTALPIKQIAAEVGFDDPLYFSRLFTRIQGLSPKAYRASIHP